MTVELGEFAKDAVLLVVGYVISLLIYSSKTGKDLAFIKGQLTQIMPEILKARGNVEKIRDGYIHLSQKVEKISEDLDAAHVKIRELKSLQ